MIIEEEKTTINLRHSNHERRFIKLYYVSLRNLTEKLDPTTLGILQKLIQHLRTDGTNGLIGETSKKYWYDTIGVSKNNFEKHFKVLKENNIAEFIRNKGIFLNPYYVRYGNEVEKNTLDMFGLIFKDNKLHFKNT